MSERSHECPGDTGDASRPKPFRRQSNLPKRPAHLEPVLAAQAAEPEPMAVDGAVDTLLNGGVVAMITDTVYGLGADATNAEAIQEIYRIKQRDAAMAVPLLISDLNMLRHLTPLRDDTVWGLLNLFWPGPLTAILPKYPQSFSALSLDDTLGVRMPNHAWVLRIIRQLGRPLAMTSANISGEPPAESATVIRDLFGDTLDLILDGGPTGDAPPSTVLDLTSRPWRILREGPITLDQLRAAAGDAYFD